jgi:hypothetical protein
MYGKAQLSTIFHLGPQALPSLHEVEDAVSTAFHLGPHVPSSYHGIEGVVSNAFHPRPWALTLNS